MTLRSASGMVLVAFGGYVEIKQRLGSFLRALFALEVYFETWTHTILGDFGRLFGRFLDIVLAFVEILTDLCILWTCKSEQ